jgi:hypothetical protein
LGYCGPPDSEAFREYGRAGVVDPQLTRLARSFAGAWPYLESIASRAGIADPLDHRVVEAYWVGNALLDGAHVTDGGVAHHSFHVLYGYPWAWMLTDERKAGHALSVLDQCRIRWGRITTVDGDRVRVSCRPLTWDGRRLDLGTPVEQQVETSVLRTADLSVGDWVSVHWHWICDRLSVRDVRALRRYTGHHLNLVNRRLCDRTELSGPAGAIIRSADKTPQL